MFQDTLNLPQNLWPINLRPLKYKAANMLGHIVRLTSNGFLQAPDGQIFRVSDRTHPRDYLNIVLGRYERDEIAVLRRWFQNDDTIIEIGSNIGVVARYAFLEKLNRGGTYICIEPNPFSHDALIANMQQSKAIDCSKNFRIVAAAICERDRAGKDLDFYARKNLCSCLADGVNSRNETVIQVPVLSFGALMSEVAPKGASLICDAEGAEIFMLKDPEAFANVRQIAIELHGPEVTGRPETKPELVAGFQKTGFVHIGNIRSVYYFTRDPT